MIDEAINIFYEQSENQYQLLDVLEENPIKSCNEFINKINYTNEEINKRIDYTYILNDESSILGHTSIQWDCILPGIC